MGVLCLRIVYKNIAELSPYKNNPRQNELAVENVANSITLFGFNQPIVIDKNNVIVAGHTRLKAASMIGMKTVPVIIADDLTQEQINAFRLIDNKTAEIARWDNEKLAQEIAEIKQLNAELEGMKIDMSLFGFVNENPNNDISHLFEDAPNDKKEPKTESPKIQCPYCGEWFDR